MEESRERKKKERKAYGVRLFNASVNHVHARALSGRRVVGVVGRALLVVRDAAQAPGSTGLRSERLDVDDAVLLDVLDLCIWLC